MNKAENLIWVDCEFTGLDYQNQTIIEIAVVITDEQLEIVAEPIQFVIHQPDEVLENATAWVQENIPDVLEASRQSSHSIEHVEQEILEYLDKYTERGVSLLCGNTIGSDRHMLYYKMPELEKWFHYRSIDVSSIKELAERWEPQVLEIQTKKETHRALDDILESIEELKIYKEHFFNL